MNNATILTTLNHVGKPTGAVDGDTEREPTQQEREVQAWRDSGGKADGPKPTGRARMCWESGGVSFHEDAWGSESDVMRRVERLQGNPDVPSVWIEYEYTATTPNAGNPVEALSLPHTTVSGHRDGNSSGGAGLDEQAGEIAYIVYAPNGEPCVIAPSEVDAWCSACGPVPLDQQNAKDEGWSVRRVRVVSVEEQR